MLEVVETCAGSQFENIGLPKLWDRAEQQFSPHYDGSDGNPRLSGPPTPRLGKKGGGRYGNLTPVAWGVSQRKSQTFLREEKWTLENLIFCLSQWMKFVNLFLLGIFNNAG